jgi:hypothetical protein
MESNRRMELLLLLLVHLEGLHAGLDLPLEVR